MIQAHNLRKSFGGRHALDGLTFSALDGSVTGLVGPNGSGKTTTLRLIAGLLHPDGGQVLVDGVDPARDPMGARRRIGVLTDGLGNYPRLTTREHLWYFGELRGMSAAELEPRTKFLPGWGRSSPPASRYGTKPAHGKRCSSRTPRFWICLAADVCANCRRFMSADGFLPYNRPSWHPGCLWTLRFIVSRCARICSALP